jgi:hypothetical protein
MTGRLGRLVGYWARPPLGVHHSIAPEHRNCNFGEFFRAWDRLLGTEGKRGIEPLASGPANNNDAHALNFGATSTARGLVDLALRHRPIRAAMGA